MEQANQEKLRLERDGKLHWYHWLLVIASLLLTFTAWAITKQQVDKSVGVRFDREAEQVIALVQERMEKYEDSLWSGVSAIQAAGGHMAYDSWRNFSESLSIDVKYPGINGIGVIHYVGQEDLPSHLAE